MTSILSIRKIPLLILAIYCSASVHASPFIEKDSTRISSNLQAIAFLDSISHLDSSKYWPNIDPVLFLQNLKTFATTPLKFYEGKSTNFCAYSALTYISLNYDPLGFSKFMIALYQQGKAKMGKVNFRPSKAIQKEAGLLKYKGALDISPAGQMWFLLLADHFKGYLNIFNKHFDKGDENTLWASTNLSKFNRMLRRLYPFKVHSRGSDLVRPFIKNMYGYLHEKSLQGPVFLYLNNRLLYKKQHITARFGIPTHYVLLLNIYKSDGDKINIVYWDYGKKTLQQVTPKLLKKIIYGITYCSFTDQ